MMDLPKAATLRTTQSAYIVEWGGYELRADRRQPFRVFLLSPQQQVTTAKVLGHPRRPTEVELVEYDTAAFPRMIVTELGWRYGDLLLLHGWFIGSIGS